MLVPTPHTDFETREQGFNNACARREMKDSKTDLHRLGDAAQAQSSSHAQATHSYRDEEGSVLVLPGGRDRLDGAKGPSSSHPTRHRAIHTWSDHIMPSNPNHASPNCLPVQLGARPDVELSHDAL